MKLKENIMTNGYRALLAIISALILAVAGLFFIANVASGSTPASFDSDTASCTTDGNGYCNGPMLPFTPNAVTVTVQAPMSGVQVIPSQVMVKIITGSFRARFFQPSGSKAANVAVTYSYLATRRTTPTPTPTPTPTSTPTLPSPTSGSSGTVIANAYVTAYGWPDNTPAGCAISSPVIHGCAGGAGTFADPITLAVGHSLASGVDVLDYTAGTKFYIPNVRRYFIVEDACGNGSTPQNGPCHSVSTAPQGTSVWVDMWIGGNGSDNTAVLACEDAVTANHTIILNPDANRVVVSGAVFSDTTGKCTAQFGG
jgi:hypothetical protein